jgi:hypothetical protein
MRWLVDADCRSVATGSTQNQSGRAWGLEPDTQRGLSLFTPKFNRAGFMLRGPMREKISFAIRRAVGLV